MVGVTELRLRVTLKRLHDGRYAHMVAEGTREETPPPALMVPEGRGSKTKNGRLRGTVKFVRNPERISHSACAPSLT